MRLVIISFGTGDRFAKKGEDQLAVMMLASKNVVEICPVWNKSNRNHLSIKSNSESAKLKADQAVKTLGWDKPYFLDANHINLNNVDTLIKHCNFFIIDVTDYIGKRADDADMDAFVAENQIFVGQLQIQCFEKVFDISLEKLLAIGKKLLFTVKQVSRIYQSHLIAI